VTLVDAFRTPLVECFRRGDAPTDVRLMAARGGLSLRPEEQLSLLMLLVSDADREVASAAAETIARLPAEALAAFLVGPDVPAEVREFFATHEPPARIPDAAVEARWPGEETVEASHEETVEASHEETVEASHEETVEASLGVAGPPLSEAASDASAPPGNTLADIEADPDRRGAAQRLAMLSVAERVKVAMQGSREERSILVRDPNRLVSSAVLSSPKLTESEVVAIARMSNVSDEVLRLLGTNRVWIKSYAVVAALTRNSKTPIAVAMMLVHRLTERDIKMLSTDRNVPEPVRLAARKIYTSGAARRQ